jgi:hypothetical protein
LTEQVPISRIIYGKNSFQNVVKTNFTQLIPPDNSTPPNTITEVKDFFISYNTIFYDIPATGSINSHLELVNRSSDYLGISYADLTKEVENLRNENVSLKQQLYTITNS